MNRPTLPHLIVILNQSDDDSAWDPAETTRQILAEQAGILERNHAVAGLRDALRKLGARIDCLEDLLRESYSSIRFIRLPGVTACARLSEQLRLLHVMIRDCSREGQRQKMEAKMLLPSKTLDRFFKLAFDHCANKVNEPFDFLKALFTVQPLPDTLSAKGEVKCKNRCKAHLHVNRHQGWNGDIIGYGAFESEFYDEMTKHFEMELDKSLASLTRILEYDSVSLVATRTTTTGPTHAPERRPVTPSEAVIWATHQARLDRLYERFPSLVIGDMFTCSWCMRNQAAEVLPCSHVVCEACLAAMGNIDESVDAGVVQVDVCNLHMPSKKSADPVKVLILPSSIGRRILSIDGGGVRGIISLNILDAIEQKLGGVIPISELFDLVGGTSVGGLAALGLVLKNWNAKHSVDILTELSQKAFTPHSQWTPIQLFERGRTGAAYETEPLENVIHTAFGE